MNSLLLVLLTFAGPGSPDVEEIQNGRTPSGQAMTLQFEEDLRFGAEEEGDEFLWSLPTTDIAVDGRGHIFVADVKENKVLEFDPQGSFVKVFAKKGPGPGEMNALNTMQILQDGSAVIFESAPGTMPRFNYYGTDLAYKDQRLGTMGKLPASAHFSSKGDIFLGTYLGFDMSSGKMFTRTGILDRELNVLKEFSQKDQSVDFQRMTEPSVLADFMGDLIKTFFSGVGVADFDAKGNIYSALSNRYEITKWTPDMKEKLLVMKRDYKPIAFSDADIRALADQATESLRSQAMFANSINDAFMERLIKRADLPPVKPPIFGLFCLPDGHILVIHDMDRVSGEQKGDLFNAKGQYIGTVTRGQWAFIGPAGQPRMIFKNGFAYTLETDEDEENRVVRYKYKVSRI